MSRVIAFLNRLFRVELPQEDRPFDTVGHRMSSVERRVDNLQKRLDVIQGSR